MCHDPDDVALRESRTSELFLSGRQTEAAIEVKTAHFRKIIALSREDGLHVITRVVGCGDVTIAQSAVDLYERLFRRLRAVVLQGRTNSIARGCRFGELSLDLTVA